MVPPADACVLVTDGDGVVGALGWRDGDDPVVYLPEVGAYRCRDGTVDVLAACDAPEVEAGYRSTALPLLLQAVTPWEVFHASAVRGPHGVVAFCGASEAGKSTIAAGLAGRGHEQWADDAVAFRVAGAAWTAALPFAPGPRPPSQAEALAAVVLVEPSADSVVLDRLAAPDAVGGLLPNAYRFRPATAERERQTVAAYLDLAARVPVLRLRYAKDLARVEELLDTIVAAVLS